MSAILSHPLMSSAERMWAVSVGDVAYTEEKRQNLGALQWQAGSSVGIRTRLLFFISTLTNLSLEIYSVFGPSFVQNVRTSQITGEVCEKMFEAWPCIFN